MGSAAALKNALRMHMQASDCTIKKKRWRIRICTVRKEFFFVQHIVAAGAFVQPKTFQISQKESFFYGRQSENFFYVESFIHGGENRYEREKESENELCKAKFYFNKVLMMNKSFFRKWTSLCLIAYNDDDSVRNL